MLLSALAITGTAAAGGAFVFRLHSTPRRDPFLTPDHLTALARTTLPRPRVLFIGNSMILRHDLPRLAADKGRFHTATAAANGARLIETVRIEGFRNALSMTDWDAVVLQDFTKTPLRAIDRFASERAMAWIAHETAPARVLLYPPWPARGDNAIYRDAGFLTSTPVDPRDFARRTTAFYREVADRHGFGFAPVPEAWLSANDPGLYADDGHHASPAGARFVAALIAEGLETLL